MRSFLLLTAALATGFLLTPRPAQACGGFFCGQQPVDQSAERILFAVNDDGSVTMITQISYLGKDDDFAWILPLPDVPVDGSLATFPQAALVSLDANTGPQIQPPFDCFYADASSGPTSAGAGGREGGVVVHVRAEVGPYDVVVVESADPSELVTWLRDNRYRVTEAMVPYIERYTSEGMKFLALKLQPDADVNDIAPFAMTLPAGSPGVPLRMTAIAAEPEMGVVVFILGDKRYQPANWPDLTIDPADIEFDYYDYRSNWASLVARAVDDAGGQGFVTEMAGPTAPLAELARARTPSDPDQLAAQEALLELFDSHSYITRMYTRLSAEEMVSDPMFRRSSGGDVDRFIAIPTDGEPSCDFAPGGGFDRPSPCAFAACGAGGLCRETTTDAGTIAGCACVPGATARTTLGPDGRAQVSCQDQRMSFLNPGDRPIPTEAPLPDPCVGFDCGVGRCVPINMTPTCECVQGMVAVGSFDAATGARSTSCVTPDLPVPGGFYRLRLPSRPASLPAGTQVLTPTGDSGCSVSGSSGAYGTLGLVSLALLFIRRRRG
jgi:MYXO-CTERM domain-containing protein